MASARGFLRDVERSGNVLNLTLELIPPENDQQGKTSDSRFFVVSGPEVDVLNAIVLEKTKGMIFKSSNEIGQFSWAAVVNT
jgi:hypothetical protein